MDRDDYLIGLLPQLPKQMRDSLEELIDEDIDKAEAEINRILAGRAKQGYETIDVIHTSHVLYKVGDLIDPALGQGKYKGKTFFSMDKENAYTDDNPSYAYLIRVDGIMKDAEDLTGRDDWGFTCTSSEVLEVIDMSEIYESKRNRTRN